MSSTTTVTFNVGMTCEGCSGAVKRILSKMDGVTSVVTDVEKKSVVVTGTEGKATSSDMLAALLKWSEASKKSVELVQA